MNHGFMYMGFELNVNMGTGQSPSLFGTLRFVCSTWFFQDEEKLD